MTTQRVPEALILMSREAFDAQFDDARLARLRALAALPEPIWVDDLDDPALTARLTGVEVLITGWGAPLLDEARLDRMPQLKVMLHGAGTIRSMVTDAFWKRGIAAANVADVNAVPVAEFTLAAVIMAGKRAPFLAADATVHAGWESIDRFGQLGNVGRTVGVVGFSRVGRRVVSALQQLEALTCLVYDPYADAGEVTAAGGRLVGTLDELLPRVDVLSLHVPALPETRNMIGAAELAALPDHATVINTARGSVIDTAALEAECASGRLNAIIDVTEPEPLPAASVLFSLPNVMVTPHIAGSLGNELYRMTDAALDELERYVRGLPLSAAISSEDLRLSA
ncbi:hydroxyacid dehydrogenase [Gryllotalpicola protaetiae]|uniref:Hydroxyacid dehydrogenase n=1 Tax=Gryllotalpicola protaetiae TaxID=2419771 RepID=A0A387BV52_9MICO|nr:hydroxyacid dehydrogenase [Gryllotalpicola protaetiae]AYG02291.1 hydroxyacid dehydrogenase [Gryllotalpicola protaetiae]